MDTVTTKIIDTLSVQNISNGNSLETCSLIVSIIALVISFLALLFSVFWNWYASWKKEITIQWTALAEERIDLWKTLDDTYKNWNGGKNNCNTLGKLLKECSIPKILKSELKMSEIDALIEDIENRKLNDKNENPMSLFNFCKYIWTKGVMLNGPLKQDKFGKVCSKLTWSLDGWAKMLYITPRLTLKLVFLLPFIPRCYLIKRFRSDWALLTILTYLELSLKTKIKERWSDRSGLFRLAYIVNKKRVS